VEFADPFEQTARHMSAFPFTPGALVVLVQRQINKAGDQNLVESLAMGYRQYILCDQITGILADDGDVFFTGCSFSLWKLVLSAQPFDKHIEYRSSRLLLLAV
jgi:hypothetical protein